MPKETSAGSSSSSSDTCPECGIDLADRDPEGHAVGHFGERPLDPARAKDAAARQKQLLDLAAKRADTAKGGTS